MPDGWIEAKAECAAERRAGRGGSAQARVVRARRLPRARCSRSRTSSSSRHVDPARAAAVETGRLRAVHVLVDRDARGEAAWCGAQYPTAAYAQAAGLSLDGYRELLGRALKLDQPDPVVAWRGTGRAAGPARLAARERRRAAHRGRGHRPARARRRPPLDQRLGPPQPPRRRGLHGAARERHGGRRDVRDAVGVGRPARRGRASALRGRALRRGRGRERRGIPQRGARNGCRRAHARRVRVRPQRGDPARRRSTRSWTRRSEARCTWRSAPPTP